LKTVRQIVGLAVIALHLSFATAPPVTGSVPEHLRSQLAKIQSEYSTGYWAERFAQRTEMLNKGLLDMTAAIVDTVNAPVLMGRYSNSVGVHSAQVFQQLLFDGPNPTGTMTDYYLENSYGKLYMTGNCYGWFLTPRSFDYYVHDGGTRNAGLVYGGPDFTIDLLVEADKSVDFSKYVKYVDGEGAHVPQLAIIHTGSDAAAGGDNIWSHRWNIRWRLLDRKSKGVDPYFDNSKVTAAGRYITNDTYNGLPVIIDGDYAIQPEFSGSSNTNGAPKPIGVFTHEFGHIFGLPDLYDTDNSSAGLGNWCLMAGGSYGGDGSHEATPAHMSAWCKTTLGWVTPVTVTTYMKQQQIKDVNRHPEIYRLNVRNIPSGQYFLVENRQKIGFDKYLLGSGLMIYHIDPSISGNSNENRRKVDLEQADGLRQLNVSTARGDDGDPYPGSAKNRNFDGYTNPNSKDYSSLHSYVGVRNISNSDTVMVADLDVGTRPFVVVRSIKEYETGTSNNNGRIDPGETGTLAVKVENIYPVALTVGSMKVISATPDVVIDTTSRNVTVGSLDTATVFLTAAASVQPSAASRKISLTVKVQTPEQLFEYPVPIFIGYPKIVLMNLDSVAADNIAAYYENAVTEIQKHSETVGAMSQTLGNAKLNYRNVVVLFSGRKISNIITDSLGAQLVSFLNSGGQLFITGQNIAEDLKKRDSPYAASLLRASWNKNVAIGRTLNGITTDLFGSQLPLFSVSGGNGAKNQTSPDELLVDTSIAHPSFIWNSKTGTAYGGVWWSNPSTGAKVVFWSFGFEAINDSAVGANSKAQALTAVFNYLDGITDVPAYTFNSVAPKQYALQTNYPNPFNPSTTISYSIPVASAVTLTIYDMLGKEIATLVNGRQSAGNFSVAFDASRLASGIYMYRLQAGNFVQTRKMTLLK
jgi:M6 family metalloprotease-like protein